MWLAKRLARPATGRDGLAQHDSAVAEVSGQMPVSTSGAERHIMRIRDLKGVGHPTGYPKDQQGIANLQGILSATSQLRSNLSQACKKHVPKALPFLVGVDTEC